MKKNEKKKVIHQTDQDVVDFSTGEIVKNQTFKTFKVDNEPDFIKCYLGDISRLKNLPKGASTLMYELLKFMNYENIIVLNSFIKKQIAGLLNTNTSVLEHQITALVSEGIMCRVGRGTFFVNPDLFGRGKWQDIYNMRLTIEYDTLGKRFKLERNIDDQLQLDLPDGASPISGVPSWLEH